MTGEKEAALAHLAWLLVEYHHNQQLEFVRRLFVADTHRVLAEEVARAAAAAAPQQTHKHYLKVNALQELFKLTLFGVLQHRAVQVVYPKQVELRWPCGHVMDFID